MPRIRDMDDTRGMPGEVIQARDDAEKALVDALVALRCGLYTHAIVMTAIAVVHLRKTTTERDALELVASMRSSKETG